MTDIDARHAVRIPLYTRVEAKGARGLGSTYSWNISEGGMCLRAPEAAEADAPVGSRLQLAFNLPGGVGPLRIDADVVWLDTHARDFRGRRSLGMGLRFAPAQVDAEARVQQFVRSFRYRMVLLDFDDPALADPALGAVFHLERVVTDAEFNAVLASRQVGLIVLGDGGNPVEGMNRLRRILGATEIELQPPIIYCGTHPPRELDHELARTGRVVFENLPLHPLEVRTLAQRLVESHVLALENEVLTSELERALDHLRHENDTLRSQLAAPGKLPGIVGDGPAMARVASMVERVAPLDTTVLVLGESGTGKDLIARAIHARSKRVGKPYVAQNCAALAESLLDDELFGHLRGAFTGAVSDRPGLFEAAEGGTVFLDEVGEMTPSMQAKLLRVLEDREVRRLGGTRSVKIDVRLICATHRDLQSLVKEGRFREDLYYRLRSFVVALPPLRERREDIQSLVLHYLQLFSERHDRQVSGISASAMKLLEEFSWPGNIRELVHSVERLVVLGEEGKQIGPGLVEETLAVLGGPSTPAAAPAPGQPLDEVVQQYERRLIEAELERSGGVVARAARALGMDRTTLSKRCKRLGIKVASEAER